MRQPPADWYLAGYFDYQAPDEALRRKDGLPVERWSKAVQNTLDMMGALEGGGSITG